MVSLYHDDFYSLVDLCERENMKILLRKGCQYLSLFYLLHLVCNNETPWTGNLPNLVTEINKSERSRNIIISSDLRLPSRTDSLGKTLMLGKIEGGRRKG